MKQLGTSCPCVPLLGLFFFSPLSLLAALRQQTALSLTEGLISVWILAQQGRVCTGTHVYMRWLKVLLSGEGQITHASSRSLGQRPKLGFS